MGKYKKYPSKVLSINRNQLASGLCRSKHQNWTDDCGVNGNDHSKE